MPYILRYTFAGIILGLLIGVPLTYALWERQQYRNFHVVREGVLYRSGRLSLDGLKRIIHDHHIKTVVTLRYPPSPDKSAPDAEEECMCREQGLHYFRLPYQAWTGREEDGASVPAEANVQQFIDIMKDPRNHPVLVHCFAGVHRTGAMCAVYRMEFERWSAAQAMHEMRAMGYSAYHQDVFRYLENYQPRGSDAGRNAASPSYPLIEVADVPMPTARDGAEDGVSGAGRRIRVEENCPVCRVIVKGDGAEQVFTPALLPGQKVRDLIAKVPAALDEQNDVRAWVIRPPAAGKGPSRILAIDCKALLLGWANSTNWRIEAGDDIYINCLARPSSGNAAARLPLAGSSTTQGRAHIEPNPAEILRALKPAQSISYLYEVSRGNFDAVVEEMSTHVDPPSTFFLIGPAQIEHTLWKCTVSYTENVRVLMPIPLRSECRREQVVYIDHEVLQPISNTVSDVRPAR